MSFSNPGSRFSRFFQAALLFTPAIFCFVFFFSKTACSQEGKQSCYSYYSQGEEALKSEPPDYQKGAELYQSAYDCYAGLDNDDMTESMAVVAKNLGYIAFAMENYQLSVDSFENSAKQYAKLYGEDNKYTAEVYDLLSIAYFKNGDGNKCISYWEKTIAMNSRIYEGGEIPEYLPQDILAVLYRKYVDGNLDEFVAIVHRYENVISASLGAMKQIYENEPEGEVRNNDIATYENIEKVLSGDDISQEKIVDFPAPQNLDEFMATFWELYDSHKPESLAKLVQENENLSRQADELLKKLEESETDKTKKDRYLFARIDLENSLNYSDESSTFEDKWKRLITILESGDTEKLEQFVIKHKDSMPIMVEALKAFERADTDAAVKDFVSAAVKQINDILGETAEPQQATSTKNDCGEIFSKAESLTGNQDYVPALDLYSQTIACVEDSNMDANNKNLSLTNVYNTMGILNRKLGRYQDAIAAYEQAVSHMLSADSPNDLTLGIIYDNMGNVYSSMDDFQKALDYQFKALDVFSKLVKNEENSLHLATVYNNIASDYGDMGDYIRALRYMENSIELLSKFDSQENSKNLAIAYDGMSIYHAKLGDYNQALEYSQKALKIFVEFFGENDADTAVAYSNAAEIYYNLRDYDKAIEYKTKSIDILNSIYGPGNPNNATTYNNMGQIQYSAGNTGKALENYNAALGALCPGGGEPVPGNCMAKSDAVYAFLQIARIDGMMSLNSDSAKYYGYAADMLDRLRSEMGGVEAKKYHDAQYYDMFPEGISAFKKAADETSDESYLEKAFDFAEKGIARVFLETLSKSDMQAEKVLPREELAALESRMSVVNKARARVEKAVSLPSRELDFNERENAYAELKQAESGLESFTAYLYEQYPEYMELMNPQTRPLSEIRGTVLGDNEAALEYYLGESASNLIFITKDTIKIMSLPYSGEIEDKIDSFREKLTNPMGNTSTLARKGAELYDMLIGPVEDDLYGITRLLIVPTGKLYFLPFEALVSETDDSSQFLVEKYEIRYAPSMNVMYLVSDRNTKRGDIWENGKTWLGFGDPVYDDPNDERMSGTQVAMVSNPDANRGFEDAIRSNSEDCFKGEQVSGGVYWPRIKGTGVEIDSVEELFGEQGIVYTGFQATEDRFKEQMGGSAYRYLHLATHGTVGLGPNQQPAVLFSLRHPEDTDVKDDGFLTMEEIFNMKVPVEMAVLSACMTGCGKEEKGEGVAGLSRALLFSGADSLVVSLWSVADEETKDLMVAFYGKLIEGEDREVALSETKREMIQKGLHPFFWAPFVFMGVN